MDPLSFVRARANYKDFTFVRRNPLHAGLWVHYFRTIFHEFGVEYAAVAGFVLYTTQLYCCLRQQPIFDGRWKDLDLLIESHSTSTFFKGDVPTTFDGFNTNFTFCLGFSIANFAKNKRDNKVKLAEKNRPKMYHKAPNSRLFKRRIVRGGDRRPLSDQFIQLCLAKSQPDPTSAHTPLAHRLADSLASEVPDLMFDYFAIHNDCQIVLTKIKDNFNEIIPDFCKRFILEDKNLPFVVGYVFTTAAGELKSVGQTTVPSKRLLKAASDAMSASLQTGIGGFD